MSDVYQDLPARDRAFLDKLARAGNVSVAALLPEIVSAHLRLVRDVPDALPPDPLRGISKRAAGRMGAKP